MPFTSRLGGDGRLAALTVEVPAADGRPAYTHALSYAYRDTALPNVRAAGPAPRSPIGYSTPDRRRPRRWRCRPGRRPAPARRPA
ncbi:hypothetical protein GCM10010123_08140 [Pilimelia anulata]|uniref:Uncharacterized protein n=1 Tax=Pilimelia anulata TaxID=53371 RepID=A0A8J3B794_9ACTN|nr:hypothetical protein GCM10010123_08140 [Pilimelia anulata]